MVSCYGRFDVKRNALCQTGLPLTISAIFFETMACILHEFICISFQALLSGCSAGGLASIFHCDEFRELFPRTTRVKCLSDAGLFLDV